MGTLVRQVECPSGFHTPLNPGNYGETKKMKNFLKNLLAEESGQDLIEYALVAALVGLGSVTAMGSLASSIANTFNTIGNELTTAVA
jgi:pilus assembly protein Flp/PilA